MGNVTGEAETMSEKDQREAAMAIEVFGLPTVSRCCNLKKTYTFHTDIETEYREHMVSLTYLGIRQKRSSPVPYEQISDESLSTILSMELCKKKNN